MNRVPGSPVMVMVFYEALCPDSKHFIIKQLEPTYNKAPSLIDFQLVPYGKATVFVTLFTQFGFTVCSFKRLISFVF